MYLGVDSTGVLSPHERSESEPKDRTLELQVEDVGYQTGRDAGYVRDDHLVSSIEQDQLSGIYDGLEDDDDFNPQSYYFEQLRQRLAGPAQTKKVGRRANTRSHRLVPPESARFPLSPTANY